MSVQHSAWKMDSNLGGLPFAPNQLQLSLSVLFAHRDMVLDELSRDVRLIEPQRSWSEERKIVSVDDAFVGFPPAGAAHKYRVVAFSRDSKGPVICTANLQDGWSSLAHRISKKLGCRSLLLRFSIDNVLYPFRGFSLLSAGETVRSVSAYKEVDRWVFYEDGEILPEERTGNYRSRLIRNRLTNEDLMHLGSALGVAIRDRESLRGPGLLLREI